MLKVWHGFRFLTESHVVKKSHAGGIIHDCGNRTKEISPSLKLSCQNLEHGCHHWAQGFIWTQYKLSTNI